QNRGAEGPCLPADVPAQDQRRSHLREGTPIPHEDRRRHAESGLPEKGDRALTERGSTRVDDLNDLRRELCDGGNGQTGNQGRRESSGRPPAQPLPSATPRTPTHLPRRPLGGRRR